MINQTEHYRAEYLSICCLAEFYKVNVEKVKTDYGTHYFYARCCLCKNYCDTGLARLWDTFGKEVMRVDIVEMCDEPEDTAQKYQAAYPAGGMLEIRDLGNNNVAMLLGYGRFKTIGPFWNNTDKLNDEDYQYYWKVSKEIALRLKGAT